MTFKEDVELWCGIIATRLQRRQMKGEKDTMAPFLFQLIKSTAWFFFPSFLCLTLKENSCPTSSYWTADNTARTLRNAGHSVMVMTAAIPLKNAHLMGMSLRRSNGLLFLLWLFYCFHTHSGDIFEGLGFVFRGKNVKRLFFFLN